MRRRHGVTLVELLVLMVVMIFFLMAATQAFNTAFQSYHTNHRILATRNYHAQLDYLFEVLEKEIGYAGSMHSFLKELGDPFHSSAVQTTTDGSSITLQYAAVERIVLISNPATEVGAFSPGNFYFSLFPATIPEWSRQPSARGSWWITGASTLNVNDPSFDPGLENLETPFSIKTVYVYPQQDPNHALVTYQAADIESSDDFEYLFLLLYEDRRNDFPGVHVNSQTYWGELISRTTIWATPTANGTRVSMTKTIPTPTGSYDMTTDLLDHVTFFQVSQDTSHRYIKVEVHVEYPGYRSPIEIRKVRYFWYYDQ